MVPRPGIGPGIARGGPAGVGPTKNGLETESLNGMPPTWLAAPVLADTQAPPGRASSSGRATPGPGLDVTPRNSHRPPGGSTRSEEGVVACRAPAEVCEPGHEHRVTHCRLS